MEVVEMGWKLKRWDGRREDIPLILLLFVFSYSSLYFSPPFLLSFFLFLFDFPFFFFLFLIFQKNLHKIRIWRCSCVLKRVYLMDTNSIFDALNCINNHVNSGINSMLSPLSSSTSLIHSFWRLPSVLEFPSTCLPPLNNVFAKGFLIIGMQHDEVAENNKNTLYLKK